MTLQEAGDSDLIFFYDSVDVRKETEADILGMLVQPKGSMFYFRRLGCDVLGDENAPAAVSTMIKLKADVVGAFGFRNSQVTNGSLGFPDRRAFTSQSVITVEQDGQTGDTDVSVPYVETADLSSLKQTSVPLGR